MSFAHVDEVRVAALARVLADAGFEPWWDDHLEPGEDWKAELMRQIAACDAFLYVTSRDSIESEWCRWELAQATALSKFIVPIIIRPGTALPRAISNLQYVDASAGSDTDEVVKLITRLARLRQTAVAGAQFHPGSLRGFPARFTRPLPRTYRTVAQGYLRPAAPNTIAYTPVQPYSDLSRKPAPIVGIDFGTTTSVVALHDGDRAVLVTNDLGETLTPSAVAIAEDGTPLVGRRALEFLVRRPERGVLEVKRLFGREMTKELGGPPVLEIDGISYGPVDLATFVLSKLRTDTEAFVGAPVWRAVLAAPASFDQVQLAELTKAARLAGFEVMRVLSEPVAACLGVKGNSKRDTVTLVYDLGGGTFDVSIVYCGDGVFEVKAVNGDTHLGGADFDREVVDHCLNQFAKTTGIDLRGNATVLMRLRDEVERAKIELSTARATTVSVPFVTFGPSGPIDLNVDLTRELYNGLTHGLVARTVALTRMAIDDAGETMATLDDVVVVGGAARAPSVCVALQDLFGDVPRAAPDHVVALGAAAQAAVLNGTLKDTLLLDTLADTLRVQLPGGRTVPVMVRHRTIPAISSLTLTAQHSTQRTVLVRILAGESSWANRNFALVETQLPCEAQKEGQAGVTLLFDVDANSHLSVQIPNGTVSGGTIASVGLRGSTRFSDAEPMELADVTAAQEALLPTYSDDRRLRPMPEASLTNLPKARWWLADAATSCVLSADRRNPGHKHADDVKRAKKIRQWLEANPDQNLPPDIADWNPFQNFVIEREFLVDLLEQRLGIELVPLRYCRSIAAMAERLVTCVRDARS